jgi:hypothetical protein
VRLLWLLLMMRSELARRRPPLDKSAAVPTPRLALYPLGPLVHEWARDSASIALLPATLLIY